MRPPLRLLLGVLAAMIALSVSAAPALAAPPANDDFASAQALDGNRGTAFFDLTDATAQVEEPRDTDTDERTIWFSYTPTASGFASFAICDSGEEYAIGGSNLTAFTGSTLATLSVDAHATGGCPVGQINSSIVAMGVSAGTTYSLQIGSTATTENRAGTLVYDFNEALPVNDDFGNAQEITGSLPQTLDADTGLATTEADEPGIEPWGPFNSIWFRWTPDASGAVSIDTCSTVSENAGSPADSKLQIFTNDNDPADMVGLLSFATADDGCAAPDPTLSHAYLNVQAGTEYTVRIVNYADKFGAPYKLNLRWVTTPELSDPPFISPQTGHVGIGQTMTAGVPDWYAEPAVTNVDLQWQLCDSVGIVCNDIAGATEETYEPLISDLGQRLKLKVTGSNGVESTVAYSELSSPVEGPPENDDFADATDLGSTAPASVASDNYYATYEEGENNDAAVPVEGSVWYRWTAPETTTYLVNGCESSSVYGFVVNVYQGPGNAVDELAGVNSFHGNCPDGGENTRTHFAATAGAVYLIQAGSIEGYGAMDFSFTVDEAPAPGFLTPPTLVGLPIEHATLTLESEPDSAIPVSQEIVWTLCDSAGANCTDLAELTTNEALLDAAMAGKRIKATVTYTNANGSVSESVLSEVIEPDGDNDGFGGDSDACPSDANGIGKSNGCPLEGISIGTLPSVTGTAQVGSTLTMSIGAASNTPGIDPAVNAPTSQIYWYSCTSPAAEAPCATRPGGVATYVPTASDIGRFIRAEVRWLNSDDAEEYAESPSTAAVTAAPVVNPPAPDPPATPPAPTNPLTLAVKPKLGNITPKKGVATLSGAVITCAATATGPCTGTVTLSIKVKSKTKKFVSGKISIKPSKSGPAIVRLSSSQLKAIKKAKSLKFTALISVTGPGFPATTATAAGTLKPQK